MSSQQQAIQPIQAEVYVAVAENLFDETQQLCLGEADPVLEKEPLAIEAAAADHGKCTRNHTHLWHAS